MDFYQYLIAILGGAFAGVINTLAGSGSAITLAILTEVMGLPGNLANGTNRVGVLTQGFASTYGFYRNGKLSVKKSGLYIGLTVIGAIAGVLVAINVSNEQFIAVFRYLLVVMLFVILIKPKRWLRETDESARPNWILSILLFLGIGFYGGFIQMGMGVFFLAIMVLFAKYSIMDANAVKAFVVALYTVFVIVLFQWKGLIDWKVGGIIAIGQTAGGYFTANYASQNEHANIWAHRLLVVVVVLTLLRMFDFL